MSTYLSKNFTLEELTKSRIAERNNIDNRPSGVELDNLKLLVNNILQPIRNVIGPVYVNSGFRSIELEKIVCKGKIEQLFEFGGCDAVDRYLNRKSHPKGQAADIEVPNMSNLELYNWIRRNIYAYDQLILEFHKPEIPDSGWVHISYRSVGNRIESFAIN